MRFALLAATGLLVLAGCNRIDNSDKAFGERVRAYLLAHPEVLQEVAQKYQDKQAAEQAALETKARADLPRYRDGVERDAGDFVANPNGAVTVTEFYDYRCPHCVNAAPKVLALIRENPDIRFVFKEMPIFGPTSEHAARAALAVKADGGDYLGAYQEMMAARPLDDEAIDSIAARHGAKPATLTSPAANAAATAHIAVTEALFNRLALGGTPAFIVGDEIIAGEDMQAVAAAIAKVRGKVRPASVAAGE